MRAQKAYLIQAIFPQLVIPYDSGRATTVEQAAWPRNSPSTPSTPSAFNGAATSIAR